MIISIKNITVSDFYLDDLGKPLISASSTRNLTNEYTVEIIKESKDIYNSINNNQAVLILDGVEQTKDKSLDLLLGPSFISQSIANALNESSNPSGSNPFATISDISGELVNGAFYSQQFVTNGNTSNKWLGEMDIVPSNTTPVIAIANITLKGVSFNCNTINTGLDIELYKNGIDSGSKVFTFQIRGKKYSFAEYTGATINFAFGDRMSCYGRDVVGYTDPQDVIVSFVFRVTSFGVGSGGV